MSDLTPIEVNDELDLVLERTIPLSVEEVWKAWTTPELLKQWFVPQPWSLADSEIDHRPGGISRVVMQSPEGDQHESVGCILEAVPNRRIVFTDALGPGYALLPEPFMAAIVDFEPVEGGTKYRAVARHANVENRKKHEEMGFHSGWGAAIDQMVELMTGIRGSS